MQYQQGKLGGSNGGRANNPDGSSGWAIFSVPVWAALSQRMGVAVRRTSPDRPNSGRRTTSVAYRDAVPRRAGGRPVDLTTAAQLQQYIAGGAVTRRKTLVWAANMAGWISGPDRFELATLFPRFRRRCPLSDASGLDHAFFSRRLSEDCPMTTPPAPPPLPSDGRRRCRPTAHRHRRSATPFQSTVRRRRNPVAHHCPPYGAPPPPSPTGAVARRRCRHDKRARAEAGRIDAPSQQLPICHHRWTRAQAGSGRHHVTGTSCTYPCANCGEIWCSIRRPGCCCCQHQEIARSDARWDATVRRSPP